VSFCYLVVLCENFRAGGVNCRLSASRLPFHLVVASTPLVPVLWTLVFATALPVGIVVLVQLVGMVIQIILGLIVCHNVFAFIYLLFRSRPIVVRESVGTMLPPTPLSPARKLHEFVRSTQDCCCGPSIRCRRLETHDFGAFILSAEPFLDVLSAWVRNRNQYRWDSSAERSTKRL